MAREIYTLSNSEIIQLVDFLFPLGLTEDLVGSHDYRKIEVGFDFDEWYYMVKVSFGKSKDEITSVTAFELLNLGNADDDVCISPVTNNENGDRLKMHGITKHFSTFRERGIKRTYLFFKRYLKWWDYGLPEEEYHTKNPDLMAMYNKEKYSYILQEATSFPSEVEIDMYL